MIRVYHLHDNAPESLARNATWIAGPDDLHSIRELWNAGHYVEVAHALTTSLNQAYTLTQNDVLSDSWCLDPANGLSPLHAGSNHSDQVHGLRSSMVGDIMQKSDGTLWVVANVGFLNLFQVQSSNPKMQ
jgi:hypothetical protein